MTSPVASGNRVAILVVALFLCLVGSAGAVPCDYFAAFRTFSRRPLTRRPSTSGRRTIRPCCGPVARARLGLTRCSTCQFGEVIENHEQAWGRMTRAAIELPVTGGAHVREVRQWRRDPGYRSRRCSAGRPNRPSYPQRKNGAVSMTTRVTGVALGGVGGFNDHEAGVLEAVYQPSAAPWRYTR